MAEAASLRAGPYRALGRAHARRSRPRGRPRPAPGRTRSRVDRPPGRPSWGSRPERPVRRHGDGRRRSAALEGEGRRENMRKRERLTLSRLVGPARRGGGGTRRGTAGGDTAVAGMSGTRSRFQEPPGSIPRPGRTRRRRRRGRWRQLVPRTLGRAAIRRRLQLLCGGRPGSLRRSRSGKAGREQREWLRGAGRQRRGGSSPPGATPWCGAP